jgi:hypothetical protein
MLKNRDGYRWWAMKRYGNGAQEGGKRVGKKEREKRLLCSSNIFILICKKLADDYAVDEM